MTASVGGECRVVRGNALGPEGLASLADKSVDHVICDPPYSERVHGGRNRTRGLNGYVVPKIGFAAFGLEQMQRAAVEAARVVRRWALLFCADHQLGPWMDALATAGLAYVRTGLFVKTDPMPQLTGDRPAHGFELIAAAHAALAPGECYRWNGNGRPMTYTGSRVDGGQKNIHPTQKPLWLMEQIVRDFTDPGDLVADPFCGVGTTGVACKRLGRRFIGWDNDPGLAPDPENDEPGHPPWAEVAAKRIAAAREQLNLLQVREPEPKQASLLAAASDNDGGR